MRFLLGTIAFLELRVDFLDFLGQSEVEEISYFQNGISKSRNFQVHKSLVVNKLMTGRAKYSQIVIRNKLYMSVG